MPDASSPKTQIESPKTQLESPKTHLESPKAPLEFKSASLTIPALRFFSNDLAVIEATLRGKIAQATEFFRDSPVMMDLQLLNEQHQSVDVEALVGLLRALGMVPVGLRGGSDAQNRAALTLGIFRHSAPSGAPSEIKIPGAESSPELLDKSALAAEKSQENRVVTQPVRSGQRVYASGDLTVTATVSAGAEIMAEGNIHVYGSLRGRALAGVQGDINSRIFCMDLQAELISIAGIYKLRDDIPGDVQHKPAHISLDNELIIIRGL